MAHTPGPWTAEPCPCGHKSCRYWQITPVAEGMGIIGEKEDAHLAAAAPDLLAALKVLVKDYVDAYGPDLKHPKVAAAHAAIAKAETARTLQQARKTSIPGPSKPTPGIRG